VPIAGYSQATRKPNIIDISQTVSTSYEPAGKNFNSSILRYYLHGDTVLRNDQAFMDFSFKKLPGKYYVLPNNERMIVTIIPTYHLIDLRRNITSTIFTKDDTTYIEFDSLKNNIAEFIYNYPQNRQYVLKKVVELDRTITLLNRKCFLGYAISKKEDSLYFYYTKTALPFASPLNRIIPTFQHSILHIGLPVNGPERIFLNLTVVDMIQKELNENVFKLTAPAVHSWPERVMYKQPGSVKSKRE
jgi:hypothetical protein